ncbi:porin family protein [Cytophaga aurantiaca]|uniref:porin family protein n=1 Tax=Cytophaga aurantiaca TaxID=29530 RepID=UPI00036C68F4|nr:porin family protein [Cytophaga aurantiaca]
MKKSIFILLISLFAYQAHSQVLISLLLGDKLNSDKIEFGLEGGANFSHISSLQSTKYVPTFNLGFYFDIQIKKSWRLYTGVLVKSNLGTKELSASDLIQLHASTYNASGTYSQKIDYFLVPVLAKYQFKNRIYLEAGPQAGLMTKGWVEFKSDSGNTTAKIKEKNTDNIHRIDFGFVGGFGYKFQKTQGVTIGVKYYYGLTDVYKDIAGSNNSSFFIKLNIPIGAGKKNKDAVAE